MGEANHLPVPPDARLDAKSVELVRVWASGGKQHVSLATKVWEDPAAWGILLVDLAKHIAQAYHESEGLDLVEVVNRIRAGFDAEWGEATDTPEGGLLE